MRTKKPENPNVFVRAFDLGGFAVHDLKNGWVVLENPLDPEVILAVPMNQPLQAEKIDSYLRAAKISEKTYDAWIIKALKNPKPER